MNSATSQSMHIAYLAPEIPALSATFVYEELLGLERRGVRVSPYSVHRPGHPAQGQQALAQRTEVLYDGSRLWFVLGAVIAVIGHGTGAAKALGELVRDIIEVGPLRIAAWKLAYQWLAGARLGRSLRRAGCAHLHVHFAHVPTQIAMYASAFSGVPFTIMAHANDIFERGLLLPQKARRAVKMLTISQHNLAYLLSKGVPPQQLEVVRCGVSFAALASRAARDQSTAFKVGTLGRLVEKKGVDDLIRAVRILATASVPIHLDIVGDGPLRNSLEALVAELRLQDHVHFKGSLAHGEVTAWLRTLDVFALACKADSNGDMDGIPVVLMEAMSQRVPVVTTRLSGIPELVMHERTGLLAQPGDPAGLAEALTRLVTAPSLGVQLADAAVQHVEAEFGQSVNLDRLMRHFRVTADGTNRTARHPRLPQSE